MKNELTLTGNGNRIVLSLPTVEEVDTLFWEIINHCTPKGGTILSSSSESLPLIVETEKLTVLFKPAPTPAPASANFGRGFMYVKCEHCGEIRGFCSKENIGFAICSSCGKSTYFTEPLVPLKLTCECGKSFRYLTNIDDDMFDIKCLECGMPNSVEYNGKVKEYRNCR